MTKSASTATSPELPSIASSNAATSVALGPMLLFSMYSDGVWSLPPIGPRPSSEGTPAAEVVLASEPPPVSASVRSKPSSAAMAHEDTSVEEECRAEAAT